MFDSLKTTGTLGTAPKHQPKQLSAGAFNCFLTQPIPTIQTMKAHMLAFRKDAWTTLAGFTAMLKHAKSLGFSEIVVIPSIFGPELTKQDVAVIARATGVRLTTCGFRAKAPISPYTKAGVDPAIATFRQQFAWQTFFVNVGVGDPLVCGPVLDDWGAGTSAFRSQGLLDFGNELEGLGKEMGLTICAEIVNKDESGIRDPHVAIPGVIRKINSDKLRLHADVVHISMLTGMDNVIPFFRKHADIIGAIECGMPGRLAMSEVPEFGAIAHEFFELIEQNHPTIDPSVEQFDYHDVIQAFGLEKTYSNRRAGVQVLEDDARFLREHGCL